MHQFRRGRIARSGRPWLRRSANSRDRRGGDGTGQYASAHCYWTACTRPLRRCPRGSVGAAAAITPDVGNLKHRLDFGCRRFQRTASRRRPPGRRNQRVPPTLREREAMKTSLAKLAPARGPRRCQNYGRGVEPCADHKPTTSARRRAPHRLAFFSADRSIEGGGNGNLSRRGPPPRLGADAARGSRCRGRNDRGGRGPPLMPFILARAIGRQRGDAAD